MDIATCKEQLRQCHLFIAAHCNHNLSHHDALICLNIVTAMTDPLVDHLQRKRTCAGRYWRKDLVIAEKIRAFNNQAKKKKRVIEEGTCCGTDARLSFERNHLGPPRPDHLSRNICDACGSALARDKKRGFVASAAAAKKKVKTC
jgi:hypothetical protein